MARLVAVLFKACRAEDAHDAFCVTAPVWFYALSAADHDHDICRVAVLVCSQGR